MTALSSKSTIAKNTLYLYIRTCFLLVISLYTSRVVLNALGVVDYGIYTAVAGVVSMLSMITIPFSNAISRFLTYEIGRGDVVACRKVFSASFYIICFFSIISILVLETIGVWFLQNKMTIPVDRLNEAFIVLHTAIVSFICNVLATPFIASLIAHERMSAYAYIGIVDAFLKLVIAFILLRTNIDKLILYSTLLAIESVIVLSIYSLYSIKNFSETTSLRFQYESKLFKKIFNYAGWQLFGGAASTIHIQGTNILLNIFGGPIVNTAQGISNQANSAVSSFIGNFTTAINPGIIKSYALQETNYMRSLIFQGARFSFYLMLIFALPLCLETERVLFIWLGQVPPHAVALLRLLLCYTLVESLSKTTMTAINATGKVKIYQIVVGGIQILNLPISFCVLKLGAPVEATAVISLLLAIIAFFCRLYICKIVVGIPIKEFWINVIWKVLIVFLMAIILPILIYVCMPDTFLRFILVLLASTISILVTSYFVGCTSSEKKSLRTIISNVYGKITY